MSATPAIGYATLARLRNGARSKVADVVCPLCSTTRTGAAAGRKILRTWAMESAIGFHCARCDVDGLAFIDEDNTETAPVHVHDGAEEKTRRSKQDAADRIWRQSYNIMGTAGEGYPARRGIELDSVPNFGGLRWSPACAWEGGMAPCILARFTAITGEPRGIWRRPIDGREPKSMTLGPMGGCVIRLWPDEDVTTALVLGEGVMTVLAAATRCVHRGTLLRPAWAAGSAGNLEAFPVLPGIGSLTLLVDHDESGRGQEAARRCGERWRAADREVTLLTPCALGADFNDLVRP